MLRRRKAEVETELPDRTDRNHFVPLSPQQQGEYDGHEGNVARLAALAKRRPLTQQEQDKLMRELAMMRMVCDTNYILDPEDKVCPKLAELEKLLDECRENDAKVIIFSEWERMLELVRELCERMNLGFAWHTGTVPQRRRRAEINAFKNDPNCRVFLSTDSGSTGLNLQCASVVINCDLPWNRRSLSNASPAPGASIRPNRSACSISCPKKPSSTRCLKRWPTSRRSPTAVLDLKGNLEEIKLRTGRQAFLAKLEQLIIAKPASAATEISQPSTLNSKPSLPRRPRARLRAQGPRADQRRAAPLRRALSVARPHSVLYVVVDRDAAQWQTRLNELHHDFFGPGVSDPLAPVNLEVVDRITHEALERLATAGLISMTTRASRPLFPEAGSAPQPLSPAERAKADAHRAHAARNLKMGRLLGGGDLAEEARSPLLTAALSLGRALAIEAQVPEHQYLRTRCCRRCHTCGRRR